MKLRSARLLCLLAASIAAASLRADWRDDIGYTRLQLLDSGELPGAPANGYTQAEAPDGSGNYAPDTTSALFSGKTFTLKSGASSANGHASSVATNFYGNTTSLLPGAAPVDLYNANSWLGSGFLQTQSASTPATESRAIQNHSWISASGTPDTLVAEINQRLDYAINRDGFVSVVGMNNGSSTTLPQLMGQGYHTISVGLVSGNHSAGDTILDGTGRMKPDLVAPDSLTSFATPMVSSAAGLLYAKLQAAPYSLTGADKPRVVKALLLATATKDTVSSWSHTPARPYDAVYGAGELNIYHAYTALRSGRVTASASSSVPARGWAAETVNASTTKTYFFNIPAGSPATPFCAALIWHRVISTSLSFAGGTFTRTWTPVLAHLNLHLYAANGFALGPLVTESISSVDNVQLVYQSALPPGAYALVVENLSTTATPYALAWHTRPAVGATTTAAIARESDGQAGAVTITRTGDTTLPLLVPLTVGGSAVSGIHYQPLPSTVTLAAGQASITLAVTPIADDIAEGDRTITVSVADDFALVHDPARIATVTLQDKPYDNWRFSHFTTAELADPAISGPTADPDADGLPNLMEYALGADPKTADAPAHTPGFGVTADHLTLTYTRPTSITDIGYTIEWTSDLQTWSTGDGVTETVSSTDNADGTTTVVARSVTSLSTVPRQFLRLRVSRQ